jgi:threonine/homoserine/homoserine lactone efflux protein
MSTGDYIKTFFSGYFINTLNPGVIGFWLVIATSVVDFSRSYRIVMFSTSLLFVLCTDIANVLLAGKLRQKLTPQNVHRINKISGLIRTGFGIALIWGTLEFSSRF